MAQYLQYDTTHPIPEEEYRAVLTLLEQAFPPVERRTSASQMQLLQDPAYRITLRREKDGTVTGFFAWWQMDGFRFGEHFAISEELRGMGIGGEMLHMLLSVEDPLVLEVEPPDNEIASRRIGFYQRHGFVLNHYDYLQPPLRPGYSPIPLLLMSHPAAIAPDEFERIRTEIYRTIYRLDNGILA